MQNTTTFSKFTRFAALLYGAASFTLFTVSVSAMIAGLYSGLEIGQGQLSGAVRIAANLALIVQFPLMHSFLLSVKGRKFLQSLSPGSIGRILYPTHYVTIASAQILLTFLLWSPSHYVYWSAQGTALLLHRCVFAASWLLLAKSMYDAHLGIQTGYIGWTTVWRNRSAISWPEFPVRGLFSICRQPIYLSFMLTLWTGPIWTRDKIIFGSCWSVYSLLAPLLKERRFEKIYGKDFNEYQQRTPYFPAGHLLGKTRAS